MLLHELWDDPEDEGRYTFWLSGPRGWDERAVLTVPGVVWTVSSDTCATGRLSAPDNVAYDHCYREFVFRQQRDAAELGAVMSADSEEVFACYRFDGLERWTSRSVAAWHEDIEVVLGYARYALAETAENPELQQCLSSSMSLVARASISGSTSVRCERILKRWGDQEARRSAGVERFDSGAPSPARVDSAHDRRNR